MFPLDPVSVLDVTRLYRGSVVGHLTKSGSSKKKEGFVFVELKIFSFLSFTEFLPCLSQL